MARQNPDPSCQMQNSLFKAVRMGQSRPDVGVKRGSQSFPILGGWAYSATEPVVSELTQSYVHTIQEEMIFQIPWKHAAKHGWDINKDACLFRSWAIHTGVQGGGAEERPGEALGGPSSPTQHAEFLEQGMRHTCVSLGRNLLFLTSAWRIYEGKNLRKHAFS